MSNILVIYYHSRLPARTTIKDHLYSFKAYSKNRVYYYNANFIATNFNCLIRRINFDLIIFHTTILSLRWDVNLFLNVLAELDWIKYLKGRKIAIPQDEFIHTRILCDFINNFNIQDIFSVAPESEWHKIYNTVDLKTIRVFKVLTGYLDGKTIKKINKLAKSISSRTTDIGYRAWRAEPWLGRHGYLKTRLAAIVQDEALKVGVSTDISTNAEDTLLGDDWYKFLLNCKYTIGVEGGASILDENGEIRHRTNEYITKNPHANFQEIEAECFPNFDGDFKLFAISPRHLEACVTKTCQILIEGNYNNILIPGQHFIELRNDFSNIKEVLHKIKNNADDCLVIAERAYNDIVLSNKYTYKNFVDFIFSNSLKTKESSSSQLITTSLRFIFDFCIWYLSYILDQIFWKMIDYKLFIFLDCYERLILQNFFKLAKIILPKPLIHLLRKIKKKRKM